METENIVTAFILFVVLAILAGVMTIALTAAH